MSQTLTRGAQALGRRNGGSFKNPLKDVTDAANNVARDFRAQAHQVKSPHKAPTSVEENLLAIAESGGPAGSPPPSYCAPAVQRACGAKKSLFGNTGENVHGFLGGHVLGDMAPGFTPAMKAYGLQTSAAQTGALAVPLATTIERATWEEAALKSSGELATKAEVVRLEAMVAATNALQGPQKNVLEAATGARMLEEVATKFGANVLSVQENALDKTLDGAYTFIGMQAAWKKATGTPCEGAVLQQYLLGTTEKALYVAEVAGSNADSFIAAMKVLGLTATLFTMAHAEGAVDSNAMVNFQDPVSNAPGSSAQAINAFGPELPEDGFHSVKGKQEEEEVQSDKDLGPNPHRSGGYKLSAEAALADALDPFNTAVSLDIEKEAVGNPLAQATHGEPMGFNSSLAEMAATCIG